MDEMELARKWLEKEIGWRNITGDHAESLAQLLRSVRGEWISVEDDLPECGVEVLVSDGERVQSATREGEWREWWEEIKKDKAEKRREFRWYWNTRFDWFGIILWKPLPPVHKS